MEENAPKKKIYQKWWFWLIAIIIILAVIGAIAGGSNSDTTDKTDDTSDKKPTEQVWHVGDTVTSGNLRACVKQVSETNEIGGLYSTEYVFLLLNVRIENIGTREQYYTSSNFYLKNGSVTYEVHTAGIAVENGFWAAETLGPGLGKDIVLVYEIPRTYKSGNYYLEVDEGILAPAVKIYLND